MVLLLYVSFITIFQLEFKCFFKYDFSGLSMNILCYGTFKETFFFKYTRV